jgi:pyruvyltransferase
LRGDPVADPATRGTLRTYWWNWGRVPNFGDELTPIILQAFTGLDVEWARPKDAELVACGSVLTHLPKAWSGTVWGTGKMRERDKIDLSQANVLALRGALSAQGSGASQGYVLGDPGLLASLLPGIKRTTDIELGVIPHWEDRSMVWRHRGMTIDVRAHPLEVIAKIASCKRVVSSSLHGIIVADAFGIPRMWTRSRGATEFKFRDHMTVVGEFEPAVWGQADPHRVKAAQQALLGALP